MPGEPRKTILVTSVGSLVGLNILDSIEALRDRLHVVGTNSDPLTPNNFRCDVAYVAPKTADRDAFSMRLRQIITDEQPDLVLAGRDADLAPLAMIKASGEFPSTLFLVPPPAAVEVVNDKLATAEFARRYALPFPETAATPEAADALIDRCGFPLISKPRTGFASRGVTIVRNRSEVSAALSRAGFVLQEYLCPPPDLDALLPDPRVGVPLVHHIAETDHYSAQAMVGTGGELLAYLATLLDRSEIVVVKPIDAPQLEQLTADYVRHLGALGFVGPLNLNCKRLSDGRFVPYELNGRFTGTSSSRALLGYPEVVIAIEHFLDGKPVECQRPKPSTQIVIRLPGRDLVESGDVDRLWLNGVWRRPART
jgi:carbamoyl-phosphate synthase large subunit